MNALPVRIRLFSSLEITLGAGPPPRGLAQYRAPTPANTALPIPSSSTIRSLLAYLILHHDQPIPRYRLSGLFWPERSESRARRALSNALWQIRQCLGPAADHLISEGDTLTFAMQPGDWLDVEAFEAGLGQGSEAPSGDRSEADGLGTAALDLGETVDLYRGDLLVNISDDWVLVERERLRERYLRALGRLILAHKGKGDFEQALTYAQRLAAADPLREGAHRELMRLYHLLGRPRAALEQYDSLRDLLAEELAVEPTAATVSLYQEIVATLAQTGPAHLPLPLPPPPLLEDSSHLPFVGRKNERRSLTHAVYAALQDQGRIALIQGEAGVGKTRLMEEIMAGAGWRGFQVGRGKPDPLVTASPYQLLQDAASSLLSPLRVSQLAALMEPTWLSAISPVFPSIADQVPDLAPLPALGPRQDQQRVWEGLSRFLTALASVAPLLLVLEDIQWADDATLMAIPHLALGLSSSRIVLALTYRPAEARQRASVGETLGSLDRALPVLRISLAPFERSEAVTFVQRALGVSSHDARATEFAERLQEDVGRNALFLVETLKSLLKRGDLSPGSARSPADWQFPTRRGPLPKPSSVQDLISERLAYLSTEHRHVLEHVAVLGESASFAALVRISDTETAGLIKALEDLNRTGYLLETPEGYHCGHDIVRDAIYRSIPQQRLSALHRFAGDTLEALHPEMVESLALHFRLGGIRDKALTYSLQAGDRAMKAHECEQALAHYRAALELVGDDVSTRWDVLAQQEKALSILSHREAQAKVLEEMLGLAEQLDDAVRQARTYHRLGWQEVLAGETPKALALLDQAIALAREAGEQELLANALISAARAWWRVGDVGRCQAMTEEARALFQRTCDPQAEMRALNMLGNLHLGLTGNYAQALAHFEERRELANQIGDAYNEAAARGNIGITYTLLGCYERSQDALVGAARVMARVGDRHWRGINLHWQGANHRALGNLTAARAAALESLTVCREAGNRNFEIAALELLGLIALDRRDPEEAGDFFEQAVGAARTNGQTMDWAVAQSHLALAHLHFGQLEEAYGRSQRAISEMEALGGRLSRMKDVCFRHYQIVAARDGYEAAQPHLERAHQQLMKMADDIGDPELRRSFLDNVVEHRAIVTALRRGRMPPERQQITVRLPHVDAPLGRPLRPDEHVDVTWTIAAPRDDEIGVGTGSSRQRAAARRRHRILRLLREATARRAAPRVADLAHALDVSSRTIKRDLSTLRAEGHRVKTRGSRAQQR